jgi:hypothetical protein
MNLIFIATFSSLLISLFYFNFRVINHFLKIDEFVFSFSISLIFTLGQLQTISLWFLLITSKPLSSFNTMIILGIATSTSALIKLKLIKERVKFRLSFFDLALISVPISVVGIASLGTFSLGDSGWDSNAYHIPLIGMLMEWGSNNWPDSVSEGTFTIYTPYGVHALQALFVSVLSEFRTASIPTGILFVGGTLLSTSAVRKKTSKIVLVVAISMAPSVFGQLSRNYVDIWAGIYLFSGIIVFVKMISLKKLTEMNKTLCLLAVFFLGLSASTKTQTLIASILSFVVILLVRQKFRKSAELCFLVILSTVFFLSSAVPYLRNLIFENNPIFPIASKLFTNGTISISELSDTVSTFRPNFWPQPSFLDPILSAFTPLWVLCVLVFNRIGIYLDTNRIDISAFAYDTTTGGSGILTSVLILSAATFSLYNFARNRRIIRIQDLNIDSLLLIFVVVLLISIQGNWYPRYGMALYLLVLLLAVRYLEKFNTKNLMLLLMLGAGAPSIFGLSVFQNYDQFSNQRNENFNPKYGLDSPPKDFSKNCKKMAILEPRPTFTSFIWEANCENIISLPSNTKVFPRDFFILANDRIDSALIGDRKVCLLRTWFDPDATYGSYLYSPISFNQFLCHSSQLKEKTLNLK